MPVDRAHLETLRIARDDEAPRARRRRWLPWTLLAAALAVAVAVAVSRPQVVAVRTAVATAVATNEQGARAVLDASGYVTARRKATISSKITGKVVAVEVEEGMRVEADQVLARLDDTTVRKQLALADAELGAARANLRETEVWLADARRDLVRVEDLVAEEVSSTADLDAARARVDAQVARLAAGHQAVAVAERRLALARQEMEDTLIRAPFAGIAISKDAQPGEMISPVSAGGGYTRTGISTIVDMESLEIEVDVGEAYLQRVHPDQAVQAVLDAYPDWTIPARVITTIPSADRQKATVKVRIAFAVEDGARLDPRILPDMGVKVTFLGGEPPTRPDQPVVEIPRRAVRGSGDDQQVWVVRAEGDQTRVEPRAVRLGTVRGDRAEILGGLAAGERVVVEGPETLAAGARVRERE
jgi:HlyD family secretion protein